MGTLSEEAKNKARRRRFAELLRRGQSIPPDLAAHFETCQGCKGRGQVGYGVIQDGYPIEVDDVCPTCNGDGFVQVSTPPN